MTTDPAESTDKSEHKTSATESKVSDPERRTSNRQAILPDVSTSPQKQLSSGTRLTSCHQISSVRNAEIQTSLVNRRLESVCSSDNESEPNCVEMHTPNISTSHLLCAPHPSRTFWKIPPVESCAVLNYLDTEDDVSVIISRGQTGVGVLKGGKVCQLREMTENLQKNLQPRGEMEMMTDVADEAEDLRDLDSIHRTSPPESGENPAERMEMPSQAHSNSVTTAASSAHPAAPAESTGLTASTKTMSGTEFRSIGAQPAVEPPGVIVPGNDTGVSKPFALLRALKKLQSDASELELDASPNKVARYDQMLARATRLGFALYEIQATTVHDTKQHIIARVLPYTELSKKELVEIVEAETETADKENVEPAVPSFTQIKERVRRPRVSGGHSRRLLRRTGRKRRSQDESTEVPLSLPSHHSVRFSNQVEVISYSQTGVISEDHEPYIVEDWQISPHGRVSSNTSHRPRSVPSKSCLAASANPNRKAEKRRIAFTQSIIPALLRLFFSEALAGRQKRAEVLEDRLTDRLSLKQRRKYFEARLKKEEDRLYRRQFKASRKVSREMRRMTDRELKKGLKTEKRQRRAAKRALFIAKMRAYYSDFLDFLAGI